MNFLLSFNIDIIIDLRRGVFLPGSSSLEGNKVSAAYLKYLFLVCLFFVLFYYSTLFIFGASQLFQEVLLEAGPYGCGKFLQ